MPVAIVVIIVISSNPRRGRGWLTREQLLQLAAIEPDTAAAVAAVDGDAVAVELGEGRVAAGTCHIGPPVGQHVRPRGHGGSSKKSNRYREEIEAAQFEKAAVFDPNNESDSAVGAPYHVDKGVDMKLTVRTRHLDLTPEASKLLRHTIYTTLARISPWIRAVDVRRRVFGPLLAY